MNLDLTGLDELAPMAGAAEGKPLELPLAKVHEDPDQPRKVFDDEALAELASSIKARGVKTPISVRPMPNAEGEYIINHGARRYRAAMAAGLETIPAFVDTEHAYVDQLVENIQREALTVPETVRAVGHMLGGGMTKSELAKQTGKSNAWVTKYAKLQALPERIERAMDDGVCRDANALGILVGCYESDSAAVVAFLDGAENAVTELDAKRLEARMKHEAEAGADNGPGGESASLVGGAAEGEGQGTSSGETLDMGGDGGDPEFHDVKSGADEGEGGDGSDSNSAPTKPKTSNADKEKPPKNKKPQIQVKVGRREGILLPSKPCAYGLAWVEYEDGTEEEADANRIKLVAVIDAKKEAE